MTSGRKSRRVTSSQPPDIECCHGRAEKWELKQEQYSPYILNITVPPIPGEILVRVLADYGICVSTGSACYAAKKKRTRVLTSMGLSEEQANSAIRISIGPATLEEDLQFFISVFKRVIPELKKAAP